MLADLSSVLTVYIVSICECEFLLFSIATVQCICCVHHLIAATCTSVFVQALAEIHLCALM